MATPPHLPLNTGNPYIYTYAQEANLKIICSADLEKLTKKNYEEWTAAPEHMWVMADATWTISNTLERQEMDQWKTEKIISAVRMEIRNAVPEYMIVISIGNYA